MCSKSNERIVSKVPMATLKEDEDEMFAFDNEIEFIEDTNESAGITEIEKNTEDVANEIVEEERNELPGLLFFDTKETDTDSKLSKSSGNSTEPLQPGLQEEFTYGNGKLIRLSKPFTADGIVDHVVFEFTDSYAPWTFTVKRSAVYVFGFKLAKANLAMHLAYGDKCTVKFKDRSRRISSISLWIGPADVNPIRPSINEEFRQWLKRKNISVKEFSDWVKNKVFFKPYFPWQEDIYSARIIDMVWDNLGVGVGAFLKLKSVYRQASEKPIARKNEESFAVLSRDDFYLCENPVGLCDLQRILKTNQSMLIQIHRMTNANTQSLEIILKQKRDIKVKYLAYIGWVGNERPTGPSECPVGSRELKSYLARNNLSVSEFEAMRDHGTDYRGTRQYLSNDRSVLRPLLSLPLEKPCAHVPIEMDIVVEEEAIENQGRPRNIKDEREVPATRIVMATKLIKSVFDIDSVDDPRVRHLLQSQEEVDIALKITTILSRAMSQRFEDTNLKLQQARGTKSWEKFESRSSICHKVQNVDPRQSEEYKSSRYNLGRKSSPEGRSESHAFEEKSVRPEKPSCFDGRSERSYYEKRADKFAPEYKSDYQRLGSPTRDYRQRSPNGKRRIEEVDQRRPHDDPLRYTSPTRLEVKRPRIEYYSSLMERDSHPYPGNREAYSSSQDPAYLQKSPTKQASSSRIESYAYHRSREQYPLEHKTNHVERDKDLTSSRLKESEYKIPSFWNSERVDEEFQNLAKHYERTKELKERGLHKNSSRDDLDGLYTRVID